MLLVDLPAGHTPFEKATTMRPPQSLGIHPPLKLLVVISILLILSTLVFAVFNTGRSSDRLRSAAPDRTVRFFWGAKDRALSRERKFGACVSQGIRQVRPLVNGFRLPSTIASAEDGESQRPDFLEQRDGHEDQTFQRIRNATQVLISGHPRDDLVSARLVRSLAIGSTSNPHPI